MDDRATRHASPPTSRSPRRGRVLAENGYRHIPVVEDGELRRHRVDARPGAHRPDPPGRGARSPRCPGAQGCDRRRDRDRRRPRPRRLLPLPPVHGVELCEKRSLEDVWHLLVRGRAADCRRARGVRRRDPAVAGHPDAVRPLLPAIAAAGDALQRRSTRCAPRCRQRRVARASGRRLDVDHATLRANAMRMCAVIPTLHHRAVPVAPRPGADRCRTPSSVTRANYLYMLTGEAPGARRGPRRRAVPDLDHRPRVQRLDVHRAGRRVDRCRPGRRGGRRPSVRCRGRCTAVRRAERSTRSTPSAIPTTPRRGSATRSRAGIASWASVIPCTRPTIHARSCRAAWPNASAPTGRVRQAGREDDRRRAGRAEAGRPVCQRRVYAGVSLSMRCREASRSAWTG